MIKNLLGSIIFILMLFSVISAQGKITLSKRVAFVNKYAFDDHKTGIKKLAMAYDAVEMADCFPSPCSREIREKKRKLVIEPVLNEISAFQKKVEAENNLLIFDYVELSNSNRLLLADWKYDITSQFISLFNNKSLKTSSVLNIDIPPSTIVTLNTEKFYDSKIGIKRILKIIDNFNDPKEICSKTQICLEIGKSIISFANRKEYGFVLDSSKTIPVEFSDYTIKDVTQEFISEYNNSNK